MSRSTLLAVATAAAFALPAAPALAQAELKLLSHVYQQPNSPLNANHPQLSADGHWAIFSSGSSGFVAPGGDGFFGHDVFVYDIACRRTELVSTTWDGQPPNGASGGSLGRSALSGDGRYAAFISEADNLDQASSGGDDIHNAADLYLVDRHVAVGYPARVRWVTRPRANGYGGTSAYPSFSADGRYLAFESNARNLVPHAASVTNVYVYDIQLDQMVLVSRDRHGNPVIAQYPRISADGRHVVFRSSAADMVADLEIPAGNSHVYLRDLNTGTNQLIDRNNSGAVADMGVGDDYFSLSGDGRFVAFRSAAPNLTGNTATLLTQQVFVRDTHNLTLSMITRNPNNAPAPHSSRWPALSDDGRYLAYSSPAPGPSVWGGIYRRELANGATKLLSPHRITGAPEDGTFTAISADGLRVAFLSGSGSLIAGVSGPGVFLSDARPSAPPSACSKAR